MADPRFFENRGPFTLAQIGEAIGNAVPPGAGGAANRSTCADCACCCASSASSVVRAWRTSDAGMPASFATWTP